MNQREKLIDELKFVLKNRDFIEDEKSIQQDLETIMLQVDNLTSEDRYYQPPTKALTYPEQAIYNLYGTYLIYSLGTKWNINFDPMASRPYQLVVRISTTNFYGSHKPLEIYLNTYRYPPKRDRQLSLVCYDIHRKLYRSPISTQQLQSWGPYFNLDIHQHQIAQAFAPNDLETVFFNLLNLARYVYDKSYQQENVQSYAKDSHIAKAFKKHAKYIERLID